MADPRSGHGLLIVWPITSPVYDRDALIAEACEALDAGDLDWVDGIPGRPSVGLSMWRVFEWWDGQLLVATMPGSPVEGQLVESVGGSRA